MFEGNVATLSTWPKGFGPIVLYMRKDVPAGEVMKSDSLRPGTFCFEEPRNEFLFVPG
jgi:hypothetical protein